MVETSHAVLTVSSLRVVHALQAFAVVAVAASQHSDVNVTITVAGYAGTLHTSGTQGVAMITFLTNVTART